MKRRKTELDVGWLDTFFLTFIIGILGIALAIMLNSHLIAIGSGLLSGWALRRIIEGT